jgi:hypothetical protein
MGLHDHGRARLLPSHVRHNAVLPVVYPIRLGGSLALPVASRSHDHATLFSLPNLGSCQASWQGSMLSQTVELRIAYPCGPCQTLPIRFRSAPGKVFFSCPNSSATQVLDLAKSPGWSQSKIR